MVDFSLYISGGWDTYVLHPYTTGMFHSLNVCFSCTVSSVGTVKI